MPALHTRTTGPTIDCDHCGGLMHHSHATTFTCDCGETWTPDWTVISILDSDLCDFSQKHGDDLYAIEQWALHPQERPPMVDPDHWPDLQGMIDAIPLPYFINARVFVAWAAMREDMDRTWETI